MAKTPTNPPTTPPAAGQPPPALRRAFQRSPNFPYIDLPTALGRIEALYQHERRNPTDWRVVAEHWDYSPNSSSMDKTVGALNAYGLVTLEGSGDARTVRLSQRALNIVEELEPNSETRNRAIRDAALAPTVHRTIRDRYGRELPSDASLRTFLVRELDFNPNAVGTVIANYRTSVEHADLDDADDPPNIGEGQPPADPGAPTIQGNPPSAATAPPAMVAPLGPAGAGIKTETFSLDRGEIVVRWPATMTAEDFENVKDWLPILERKLRKSATVEPAKPADPE